jgi:hypothetical protein
LLFKIFECVLFPVVEEIGKYINSDAYPTRWIVLLKLHVTHSTVEVCVCVFISGRYFSRFFFFISFSTKSTHADSQEHVFDRLGQYENDVPRTYIIITLYTLDHRYLLLLLLFFLFGFFSPSIPFHTMQERLCIYTYV